LTQAGTVLLLGASGQLGTELARSFAAAPLIALDRRGADLSRPESLRAVVREIQPQLILNAAAYTAVDRAESEAELADVVNHQAPRVLAEEAERLDATLVHYSTDYVFDGTKQTPWVETDPTAPLNVYGRSKRGGEVAIAAACRRHIILRTSWVYADHGSNFLRTMLRLGAERPELRIVEDQWGAPTTARALAEATYAIAGIVNERVLEQPETWAGIYHATCAGKTTWRGFAEAIFALESRRRPAFVAPHVEGVASADYPTPARRPRNSVLSNEKLRAQFGVQLPAWHTSLQALFLR
jgi:dTDP-4-dehydrorhamnose reductase